MTTLLSLVDISSGGVHTPARADLTTLGIHPSFRATTVPYLSVLGGLQRQPRERVTRLFPVKRLIVLTQ